MDSKQTVKKEKKPKTEKKVKNEKKHKGRAHYISCQIVCDPNLEFLDNGVKWPGSVNDSNHLGKIFPEKRT